MALEIVNPRIEEYMHRLARRHDDDVVLEMERYGEERGFPLIGRLVGVTAYLLAQAIDARRVFELGSGFGYSAYWFCRAVGEDGDVHLTDNDPENERKAMEFLARAGFADRVRFHVGDALDTLEATEDEFDVVFCDIDKYDYPRAWAAARDRIRVGGLYLCDNVLWSGRVVDDESDDSDERPGWTEAVKVHNENVAGDERYVSSIVPTRDGLMVALRIE